MFLATVFQVLSVNNPDMSGDTAKFGLAGWRDERFLEAPEHRTAWAKWVNYKIFSAGQGAHEDAGLQAFFHFDKLDQVKVRVNQWGAGVEATQDATAGDYPGTADDPCLTLPGEIWRIMSGRYADCAAAESAWLGTDFCRGNNPPALVRAIINKVIKELLPGLNLNNLNELLE